MTEQTNMSLWETLGKTDPSQTKGFVRAGGFKGTAIKPMWSYQRMTEVFGPAGKGWGVNQPTFSTIQAGNEILVYCTVSVWWGTKEQEVYGVGGDKVLVEGRQGVRSDDEAFKKSFTDAVTNALKLIGVGADVHMGRFDDSKYVDTMTQHFEKVEITDVLPTDVPAAKASSASLKRLGTFEVFEQELNDVHTAVMLAKFTAEWRQIAVKEGWNKSFLFAAKDKLEQKAAELAEAAGDLPEALEPEEM